MAEWQGVHHDGPYAEKARERHATRHMTSSVSKKMLWTSRITRGLPALFRPMDGVMKLVKLVLRDGLYVRAPQLRALIPLRRAPEELPRPGRYRRNSHIGL